MNKDLKQIDFESAMTELASLITVMEQDDLSLDAALKNFEKGIALTRICQSSLDDAQQRVSILTQGVEEDFVIDE